MTLRVRKSDKAIVESIIEPAVKEYKKKMLSEVKALEDKKDIPCVVNVDPDNFLPEWNEKDQKASCLGGFIIYCKKNRIVCSQTLDDRMSLVY